MWIREETDADHELEYLLGQSQQHTTKCWRKVDSDWNNWTNTMKYCIHGVGMIIQFTYVSGVCGFEYDGNCVGADIYIFSDLTCLNH